MRGTSTFAVAKDCVIKGTSTTMREVADAPCSWCTYSLSVNVSSPAGVKFYQSILEQYALEWQVDFLKNDCVFGSQFVPDEIEVQSTILESLRSERDIVYSLSPGGHGTIAEIVAKGRQIASISSMYRVNNDDWDNWDALKGHFDVAAAFADARLAGVPGLNGRPSFPDFDMLPLGFITSPSGNKSHFPYHMSNLTQGEQRMQMALWGMAPSPLFFGGDMRRMDAFTLGLLTNADILKLNNLGTKSEQIRTSGATRVWRAHPSLAISAHLYVGAFNTGGASAKEVLTLEDFGANADEECSLFDVWTGKRAGSLGSSSSVDVQVASHDVVLLRAKCV